MAKVYSAPDEIKEPSLDFKDIPKYHREQEEYIGKLREWVLKRNPKGECVGEVVRFPVADGHAQYMVAGLKPVELVHIPLGDAWDFQYANRLTAKDLREKIANQKAIDEMFAKKLAAV